MVSELYFRINMANRNQFVLLPHHSKEPVCNTRSFYRRGKVLKGVKPYTVNNESKFVLVMNVPAINLSDELKTLLASFGDIESFSKMKCISSDSDILTDFTEVYLVKYKR